MKRIFLVALVFFCTNISLEPPKLPFSGKKRSASPGRQPESKVAAIQTEAKAAFESLPIEIKNRIALALSETKGNDNKEKLKNAVQVLHALLNEDKFNYLTGDENIISYLISELANRFTDGDVIEATIAFNAITGFNWLKKNWNKFGISKDQARKNFWAAINNKRYKIVTFLLETMDKNLLDNINWRDALAETIQAKDHKMLALLLSAPIYKKNTNEINDDMNFSVLAYEAIQDQDLESLDLLLKAGAKIDPRKMTTNDEIMQETYKYAPSPIIHALNTNNPAILKRVVSAVPDLVDEKIICPQKTPLMLAVKRGDVEMVKILIDAGADVNYQDRTEKTAFQRVGSKNREAIIKLLKEKGARIIY